MCGITCTVVGSYYALSACHTPIASRFHQWDLPDPDIFPKTFLKFSQTIIAQMSGCVIGFDITFHLIIRRRFLTQPTAYILRVMAYALGICSLCHSDDNCEMYFLIIFHFVSHDLVCQKALASQLLLHTFLRTFCERLFREENRVFSYGRLFPIRCAQTYNRSEVVART
mgnify:CR=1 FL=1